MAAGHGIPRVRWEIALDTDPYVRPGPGDWTDPTSEGIKLTELTTVRGATVRTPGIETGSMTLVVSDQNRVLDDANEDSPWFDRYDVRRRIRAYIDPANGPERLVFTGFIERTTRTWRKEVAVATIVATDLFGLISGSLLPPSVLQAEMIEKGFATYWPLGETGGYVADDFAGSYRGRYVKRVESITPGILPYDPRGSVKFILPSTVEPFGQTVIAPVPPSATHSMVMWVQNLATPSAVTEFYWTLSPGGAQNTFPALALGINIGADSVGCLQFAIGDTSDTAEGIALEESPEVPIGGLNVTDGLLHMVSYTIDMPAQYARFYVDGIELVNPGDVLGWPLATDWSPYAAAMNGARIGVGSFFEYTPGSSAEFAAKIAHVGYCTSVLSDSDMVDIYAAGVAPWEDDVTGMRIDRVLDVLGVDPDDRALDAGTQTCGHAVLNSENGLGYIRKAATTEGGAVFVNPDGQVASRPQIENNPASTLTISDDPVGDSGVPYSGPLTSEGSVDRVINVADVTRPGADTKRIKHEDSARRYGERTISLDVLSDTPAGATLVGALIVAVNRKPRQVFEQFTLEGRDGAVTDEAVLDTELGDAVTLIARPPGGGDPATQLSILERIEQHVLASKRWDTKFNASQHIVLPFFAWDTPGAGWDEAVWAP